MSFTLASPQHRINIEVTPVPTSSPQAASSSSAGINPEEESEASPKGITVNTKRRFNWLSRLQGNSNNNNSRSSVGGVLDEMSALSTGCSGLQSVGREEIEDEEEFAEEELDTSQGDEGPRMDTPNSGSVTDVEQNLAGMSR